MKNYLLFLLLVLAGKAIAQDITVSWYVRDEKSKETLLGVNVYSEAANRGTTTNEYGFYSFTVRQTETVSLRVSFKKNKEFPTEGWFVLSKKNISKNP